MDDKNKTEDELRAEKLSRDTARSHNLAFVELRVEAALEGAAVIAAQFTMGAEPFAQHARECYLTASRELEARRAAHLAKLQESEFKQAT